MNYIACNVTLFGNCKEAIDFYQECFHAEVTELVTYAEVAEQLNFSEAALKETFAKLSVGGKTNIEPRITEEGIMEGSLIDRFGVCWILRSPLKC